MVTRADLSPVSLRQRMARRNTRDARIFALLGDAGFSVEPLGGFDYVARMINKALKRAAE